MSYDNYYFGEDPNAELDSSYMVRRPPSRHPHHHRPASPPRPPSALENCMMERNRRHPAGRRNNAPTGFYDTAYDDVLEMKRAAYARNPPPPPPPQASSPYHRGHHPRQNNNHAPTETMLELGPGVYARLRGAQETWNCIEHDFHMPVICFACSMELCCIQDASYVLCPSCRTVSPIENGDSNHNTDNPYVHQQIGGGRDSRGGVDNGGVGLGFTFEELFKWQAEIMRRRHDSMMRARDSGYY